MGRHLPILAALWAAALPAHAAALDLVIDGAGPAGRVRAMVFADADSFVPRSRPVAPASAWATCRRGPMRGRLPGRQRQ